LKLLFDDAPRSGGRKVAGGTRFLCTPGKRSRSEPAPREGWRGFLAPFQGAVLSDRSFPVVRKRRVPPATFPSPLRGASSNRSLETQT